MSLFGIVDLVDIWLSPLSPCLSTLFMDALMIYAVVGRIANLDTSKQTNRPINLFATLPHFERIFICVSKISIEFFFRILRILTMSSFLRACSLRRGIRCLVIGSSENSVSQHFERHRPLLYANLFRSGLIFDLISV